MCPKIIDKQIKRKEILKAAMKVFAQQGVSCTKMEDVAREAGIGKGTIYEYFKSKDDIFREAFNYFTEQLDIVMSSRLYNVYDPIEKLKALVSGWMEVMQGTSIDFLEIMIDFWAEGVRHHKDTQMFNLNKMYEEYRGMFESIIAEGIKQKKIKPMDIKIAASILIGAMDGITLQWILDRELFDIEEATGIFIQIFLRGFGVSK